MKQHIFLYMLVVIWCFEPGFCYDLDTDKIEKTDSSQVQEDYHYSYGILMSTGDDYLVIDDHYIKKAVDFEIEADTTGKKIWFRQNKWGEIVEVLIEISDTP